MPGQRDNMIKTQRISTLRKQNKKMKNNMKVFSTTF